MALSCIISLSLTRFSVSTTYYSILHSKSNHIITPRLISAISTSTRAMASSLDHKIAAPYGSWKSPLTADVVSGSSKRLGGTAVDSHGRLIWLESRPTESGSVYLYIFHFIHKIKLSRCYWIVVVFRRAVLVKEAEKAGDEPVDITPKEFGVRTVAQEYGGGAFSVSGDTVIFSNYKDQRLYKQSIASKGILYCSFVWNSTMSFCIKLLNLEIKWRILMLV